LKAHPPIYGLGEIEARVFASGTSTLWNISQWSHFLTDDPVSSETPGWNNAAPELIAWYNTAVSAGYVFDLAGKIYYYAGAMPDLRIFWKGLPEGQNTVHFSNTYPFTIVPPDGVIPQDEYFYTYDYPHIDWYDVEGPYYGDIPGKVQVVSNLNSRSGLAWGNPFNDFPDYPIIPGYSDGGTTPPTILSLSPADESTDVSVNTNLVMIFSEDVFAGAGNITIRRSSDNIAVETIGVTSGQVT